MTISDLPEVSLVMPVFNSEAYIDESIQSVVDQSFSAFELILVDDCSSDDSLEHLLNWQARDSRIKVVKMPANGGNCAARNAGIEIARAPWIAVVDSDDICLPWRLERQMAYLAANDDVDLVGSHILLFDDDVSKRFAPVERSGGVSCGAMPAAHGTMIIRRELFEHHGGYDTSFRLSGDHDLVMRFVHHGCRSAVIDEPLMLIRRHGTNITLRRKREQTRNSLRVYGRVIFKYRMHMKPRGYLLMLEYLLQYLYLCSGLDRVIPRRWIHWLLRRQPKRVRDET